MYKFALLLGVSLSSSAIADTELCKHIFAAEECQKRPNEPLKLAEVLHAKGHPNKWSEDLSTKITRITYEAVDGTGKANTFIFFHNQLTGWVHTN